MTRVSQKPLALNRRAEPRQQSILTLFETDLLAGLALALVVGLLSLYVLPVVWPDCLFKALGGLPCPLCGGTHVLIHLLEGRPLAAFRSNPGVSLLLLLGTIALAVSLRRQWMPDSRYLRVRRFLPVLVLGVLGISWGVQLLRIAAN